MTADIPKMASPVDINEEMGFTYDPDLKKPVHGYPKLANLMGSQPGLAIVRRFATLNAKNLLYMQAELLQLEKDLARLEQSDSQSEKPRMRTFATVVRDLMEAEEGVYAEQWQKVLEIRAKLKEYNEHVLVHSRLYQLPLPNPYDYAVLRDWIDDPKIGRGFLEYPENTPWENPLSRGMDLVALSARRSADDLFTRWFTDKVIPWLHYHLILRFKKPIDPSVSEGERTYKYSDTMLNRVAENVTLVVASAIPSLSIFALFYVKATTVKLILITVFSVVFSSALAIFTTARRVEIFTGTVALASVQVVFVGTSNYLPSGSTNGTAS